MISRISGVTQVQDTGTVSGASAWRSPLIPAVYTNGLTVQAASLGLPRTVGTSVAAGSYFNAATIREPVTALGVAATQDLGISRTFPGERIWVWREMVLHRRRPAARSPCSAVP